MATDTPATDQGSDRLRGIVLMIFAVFCFVSMDAIVKQLTNDYAVPQVIWARYVFHLILMVCLFGPRHRLDLFRTSRLGLQILRSLLLFGATACMFTALKFIQLAEASTIGFINPLIVTALSVPMLGEKVGGRRWAAVVAGFIGVLIVLRPGLGVMHWAAVLPLCMAFCYAFYQIMTRLLAGTDDPQTILFYTALVGSLITSVGAPFYWTPPDAQGWSMMAAIGLIGGIGHFALIKAFEVAPASVLAPFSYAGLVWAVLFGYLFFGDLPDAWTGVGALVIVSSGLYIIHRERRLGRTGASGPGA